MKKKMFCVALLAGLLASGTMTAYATESKDIGHDVKGGGRVEYTEAGKISDNLGSAAINDEISKMQPGDTMVVSVELKNNNGARTHWYMKNRILESMEEASTGGKSGAAGGAYGYTLAYVSPSGDREILFESDKVGGDGDEGLKDLVVNKKLGEDYFYLCSMEKGEGARVELTVELDGETQGNSYQDQVANLAMNFAVEPQPQGGGGGKTHHRTVTREVVNNEIVYLDENGVPLAGNDGVDIVRTGDEQWLFPYVLAACASGCFLMVLGFFGYMDRKKEEGGAVK